jgi:hypothetical protein
VAKLTIALKNGMITHQAEFDRKRADILSDMFLISLGYRIMEKREKMKGEASDK